MNLASLFLTLLVLGACGGGEDGEGIGGDCTRSCQAKVAAACTSGPTLTQCTSNCRSDADGQCGTEFKALLACGDGEAVSCDNGTPVVAACSDEQDAFELCDNG
jgi:hypothetical protein